MTPHEVLKKYWNYDDFRPLQLEIINSVLVGKDTLGLMPTGGGKSLTFQIPAIILPGLTIVVTPLISLMKDQVDNLAARNIKAATLYSGMTLRERNLAFDRARLGKIKLLYVSPERLRSDSFQTEIRGCNVSLIVVDEAHCISQWGYDFRPSYLRIASLRETFPGVPVLALTASATPVVKTDIIANLDFRKGYQVFSQSFHRNNLSYIVRHDSEKESKLIDSLNAVRGSAIVYVRSRRATAGYAEALNTAGISATFYHAGLDPKIKEERQQLWKENKVRVMVATNAFGMGIDKPDVRVVVHMDIPPSLEEYYQEAGRAGRDGKRAYALMLATVADKAMLTRRLNSAFPPKEFILEVYEKACVFMDIPMGEGYGHIYDFDIGKFCKTFRFDSDSVVGALNILSNSGYFDYSDDPTTRARAQILIRKDEFYGIVFAPDEAKVINSMLRLFPGLFADYVSIDEDNIAMSTTLSREDVYQALLSLSRKKIIHYIPKRIIPYIYLPTSREEKKHIVIPKSVYEERKELMRQRLDAIRQFVFSGDACRDTILLNYFGEENASECGICDICVEKLRHNDLSDANSDSKKDARANLKTELLEVLSWQQRISLHNLLNLFPSQKEEAVEILRALIEQKIVLRSGNFLSVKD